MSKYMRTIVVSSLFLVLAGCQSQTEPVEPTVRKIDITQSIRVPVPDHSGEAEQSNPHYKKETIVPVIQEEAISSVREDVPSQLNDSFIRNRTEWQVVPMNYGDRIDVLQKTLIGLGYDIVPTGEMDAQTERAIASFQVKQGLDATGRIDSPTSIALTKVSRLNGVRPETQSEPHEKPQNDSGEATDDSGETALSSFTEVDIPPTDGYWAVVNKSNMKLLLFKGNKIEKTVNVSVGREEAPTPDGKFSIIVRAMNPSWGGMGGRFDPVKGGDKENPLGSRWMGLNVEGTKGTTYGLHGSNRPDTVGSGLSYGCVRMKNEDVEMLYDILPNGTPVWIGTSETLVQYGLK